MKLYRFRPLSDLLFKELLYNELYLASPNELNDPLDLNGQLNFFSDKKDDIMALGDFILRKVFCISGVNSGENIVLLKILVEMIKQNRLGSFLIKEFADYI